MLSLPQLFPQDPHTLYYPTLTNTAPPRPPSPASHLHPHQRAHNPQPTPHRTPLTTLAHDELLHLHRKGNIARFGSGWLRPPGLPKTLQGMADERAEREEGEAVRAREMEMEAMGMMASATGEEEEEELEVADGEGMGEGGRDLDDEVPEADGGGGGLGGFETDEEEEEEEEEDEGEGWFDQESEEGVDREEFSGGRREWEGDGDYGAPVLPPPTGGRRGALLPFTPGGFAGGGMPMTPGAFPSDGLEEQIEERDLDEEVPDADERVEEGSYEHTDTEVEDASSDEDGGGEVSEFGGAERGNTGVAGGFAGAGVSVGRGWGEGVRRSSARVGERLLGGDVLGSSPVPGGSGPVVSGRGGRRSSGRRGVGREN